MSKKLYFLISFVLVLSLVSSAAAQTVWDLELHAEYLFETPDPCADTSGSGYDIIGLTEGATVGVLEGFEGTAYHGDIGDYNTVSGEYQYLPYAELPSEAWPGTDTGDFTIELMLYFDVEHEEGEFGHTEEDGWPWWSQFPLFTGGFYFQLEYGEVNETTGLFEIGDNLWLESNPDWWGYVSTINYQKETWYHWIVSFDNTNKVIRHWVDGELVAEDFDHASDDFSVVSPGEITTLGSAGGSDPLRGRIDNVRFYKGYTEEYFEPIRQVQVSNLTPAKREGHVHPDTNLCFQAPRDAICMDPNANLKGPFKYDVYFGTEPNVLTMTQLADACQPAECNDVMCFDPCAGNLLDGTTYYWQVDINDLNEPGDSVFYTGPLFSFRTWGFADNPIPADNQRGTSVYTDLTWTGDDYAASFGVYFGTSWADVNDGTAFIQTQGPNTYDPGTLLLGTDYFWRIDEVNGDPIKGNVWSFTTASYLAVDDFDSYENDVALQAVWTDYWTNDTGAEVFLEDTIIHDGNAMRCDYDNLSKLVGQYGSMTDADIASLSIGPNWSGVGGKALQLYFYGDVGNSATVNDKMYVALEDASANVGVLYYPDVNDINVPVWQQWNIDLQDFNSQLVDLTNIAKVSIGFGTYGGSKDKQGGTGVVFFDDFSVWRTRCVQEFALGDIDGDCIINGYDLQAMAGDWLISDYTVLPEPPNSAGLLIEYLFEGTYNDTSGNNLHGIKSTSGSNIFSGTLSLDGVGYVDIPFGGAVANPFGGTQDFSISMWAMTSADGLLISSSEPNDASGCDMSMNVYIGAAEGDDGEVVYDNVSIGWMGAGALLNDGQWHHIVTTYDAATLQHHIYADGIPETWPEAEGDRLWDPNITDIATHTVRIGWTYCDDAQGYGQFDGYIDTVQIYDYPLSRNEVMYLAGGELYVPLDSQANFVPKVGPFGWDPNNVDIINFRDYAILADHWLEGPTLWP